ncbi:hypothetical protein [Kitasatospora sp. NPDC059327]
MAGPLKMSADGEGHLLRCVRPEFGVIEEWQTWRVTTTSPGEIRI